MQIGVGTILGEIAQFHQGRIHVDQTGRCVGGFAFGNARAGPYEWDLGSSFPQDVFRPVPFFAKVVTMVAPEDDNRVIGVWTIVKRRQDTADLRVGVGDGCEVPKDAFF